MATQTRAKSNLHAYFSLICAVSVGGPSAMAYAFAQGGWSAFAMIALTGVVAWYTGVLLIQCVHVDPKGRLTSYAAVAEAAFGRVGCWLIHFFQKSILLGVSALFIKLSGINLNLVAASYGVEWGRPMKELWVVSMMGLLVAALIAGLGSALSMMDIQTATARVINLRDAPAALGTIGFAFGGNVIFTHVEAGLHHKPDWSKVLGAAMLTVAVLYIVAGLFGYLAYGEAVNNPITLSLPKSLGTYILTALLTLHLILATPIYLLTFSMESEPKALNRLMRVGIRIIIISLLVFVAVATNHFGPLMSLVGAISNLVVVFITPVILNLKLLGWRSRSIFTYLGMSVCLLMGLVGGILGIITAARDMVNDFS
ncbi:hypothetical protein L0F63_005211 [Massospora cicadina]|nr:hypothetical protein L0F63_005211 [Massospora cicadina]